MAQTTPETTDDISQDPAVDGMTLHQRIRLMQRDIGRVDPTGRSGPNQGNKPAISIEDVENEVREPCARYGIVTRWSDEDLTSFTEQTAKGNDMTLWKLTCHVTVTSSDDREDEFTDRVIEIGNSPASASAFAAKRYYKRLFHIASGEEEHEGGRGALSHSGTTRPARAQTRPPRAQTRTSGNGNLAQDAQQTYVKRMAHEQGFAEVDTEGMTVDEGNEIVENLTKLRHGHITTYAHPRLVGSDVVDDGPERNGLTAGDQEQMTAAAMGAQSSPYKPASANQLATIAKLSRLLGTPEDPSEDMSSAEASERITELSRQYNSNKKNKG